MYFYLNLSHDPEDGDINKNSDSGSGYAGNWKHIGEEG